MIETQAPPIDILEQFTSTETQSFWLRQIAIQLAQLNETAAAILFAGLAPLENDETTSKEETTKTKRK